MAAPFAQPVICPVVVGRDADLAALARELDRARSGAGHTVLVAGEAGVGKSRLVAEAKIRAAHLGLLTVEGHCFEPDRPLPYAPLLDLLRSLLADRPPDEMAAVIGPSAAELATLLPELLRLMPGLVPTARLEPEQEKRRLSHALVRFFAYLAAPQPALVIVEDMHWSDDTSLEFLLHLARWVATHPVLLLLTYRSDEVGPALSRLLAELARGRLATELRLLRLSAAEVGAMLRAIFGPERPVRAGFLEALYALTEGNPFFVEEVLTSLAGAGESSLAELRIPHSLQETIRRRAAWVSEPARQTLALAAVAGRRFDFALLQALTRRDEAELLQLIKELIAAQLVVEASAEQFAFRHALTRQAIYAELLARERQAMHQRIAETLERLAAGSPDMHLEDLAYHFYEAGGWAKALAYARQAGERVQALYAPRAAVEQFTRALEAAGHLASVPPPELRRARGQAYATLGDFEPARADLETARDLAQAAGDQPAEWQLLLDLGLLWASRDYARAGDYYRQALALARVLGEPAALAHSLNRLGNWHSNVDQPLAGRQHHEEALVIFQALNDRRGIAETLDLLGVASNMSGDLLQSAVYYQQAVVLFREFDDRQALASSLTVLAEGGDGYFFDTVVSPMTALAEFLQEGELALRLARETGWRAGEAYALGVLGDCLGTHGEYGRAWRCLAEALAIAEEIEHREWMASGHCSLGMLHRDLLTHAAARQHLEQALAQAQAMRSLFWERITAGLLSSACVAGNDLARATTVLAATLTPDTPTQTVGQRLCWCARAELALARGEPDLALEIIDRLIASAPNLSAERIIPRLWHLRAEALVGLQRAADAEVVLRAAAATAATQGRRPLLWRIHAALGRLYAAARRYDEAERASAIAGTLIGELAAAIPDLAVRETFVQRATARLPRPQPLSPRRAAKGQFGGLTAREREVAALIAQGNTSRAIAATLAVSERTIEGHVASILSKLGFSARTQIAAWAVEQGLAGSGT